MSSSLSRRLRRLPLSNGNLTAQELQVKALELIRTWRSRRKAARRG